MNVCLILKCQGTVGIESYEHAALRLLKAKFSSFVEKVLLNPVRCG
jgi:hypothetical protein